MSSKYQCTKDTFRHGMWNEMNISKSPGWLRIIWQASKIFWWLVLSELIFECEGRSSLQKVNHALPYRKPVQSLSCAPHSGVYLCTFFHVRYGVSIQTAMSPETGNLLVEFCWETELKLKNVANKSLKKRHYFPSKYKTCHSIIAAPMYNVLSSVNCRAYRTEKSMQIWTFYYIRR